MSKPPHAINPQIAALRQLQRQDRRLTLFERRQDAIPGRLAELDTDLQRLETMLQTERRKLEETRTFQRQQEGQLDDEEEQIRQSKAKLNLVKTPRELSATQRELETTRRMATARSDEIQKVQNAIKEAEVRIATMEESLTALRTKADDEKTRLLASRSDLEQRIQKLRTKRVSMTQQIERGVLQAYERIRRRLGGVAFVAASQERCTACKMRIPHQMFSRLMKGDEIIDCEHCGRLLFWRGHFSEEPEKEATPAEIEARDQRRREAEAEVAEVASGN